MNETRQFIFYDLYYNFIKDKDDKTVGVVANSICSYIFDNEAVINFDEPSLDLIWSSIVDFLEKDKEFAKSGKTPKSLYKDMKHFTFFDNYYKAMKLLNEEQCGEYIKALCEFMFYDKEPKKLMPPVSTYFEMAKLKLKISKVRVRSGRKGGEVKNKVITKEFIESKIPQHEYGLTFEEFTKKHDIVNDLYGNGKNLLNGVDWRFLSMCLENNEKYKNEKSLYKILANRKEIENVFTIKKDV